jgi:hypothetical protein
MNEVILFESHVRHVGDCKTVVHEQISGPDTGRIYSKKR